MGVPVMAIQTGDGVYGQYAYDWVIECGSTAGRASITSTSQPTNLGAYAKSYLFNSDNDVYGYSDSDPYEGSGDMADDNQTPTTGYANVTAYAQNSFEYKNVTIRGEVQNTFGRFWVNSFPVVEGIWDIP